MIPKMGYRVAAVAVAVAFLGACAPGIKVARTKPSRFNLGATRSVAVLQVGGDPRAASQVMVELQRDVVNRGYYQLINAVDRGITISIGGMNARVDIGTATSQVQADVYLVANVLRYEVVEETREEKKTEKGRSYDVLKVYPKGYARVNFQVVKSDGRVLVFRDYLGDYSGSSFEAGRRPSYSRHALLEGALGEAVSEFMSDITPRQVVEKIELDDDDPALKPGIELAENGNLAAAERSWQEVLRSHPRNAGATYNLGVLLETRGEFEAAESAYRKAFDLAPKPLYRNALEDLRQRLADAESLQTHI